MRHPVGCAHNPAQLLTDVVYPAPVLDPLDLLADVTSALATDDVDLVDLSRASGLLRFRAATEGVPVHEDEPGRWQDFILTAALHWYDVEPVVREAHDHLLEGLRR